MPESLEERVSSLESKVAELELAKRAQEERDIALLARIDGFIDDLRRVERTQLRAFDAQAVQLNSLARRMDAVETGINSVVQVVNNHSEVLTTLADAAKDHKAAIERLHEGQQALQAGQDQILAILTGKAKTND